MGPRDRRDREKQETRELIISAARELFAMEGYESVTMRQIADKIEYTPTAIYHHFKSKEELLTALCHGDFHMIAKYFQRAAHIRDPLVRACVIGRHYVNFAAEYPNHYRFMFMTMRPVVQHSPEFIAETFGNPQRDAYSFLRNSCSEAIESGRLRSEFTDPDQMAQMFWASLHGLISLRMVKGNDPWIHFADLNATAHKQMETLYAGMLKNPSELTRIRADVEEMMNLTADTAVPAHT